MSALTHSAFLASLVFTLCSLTAMASGDVFLGSRGARVSAAGHHNGVDLLHELEQVSGRDHRQATESRVGRLEEALRPMFQAMPKDASDLLDSAGVRYMLHRMFVQRHGWFVVGLDNDGDSWNSSSPAAVFKAHSSEHHELFGDKLNNHGFSLHQVAVFAATLETLVHGESIERLQTAYRVLGFERSETLSDVEGAEVIEAYMLMYVQETNLTSVTPSLFKQKLRMAAKMYQTWGDTQKFAQAIRQRILEDTDDSERNTWETNLKVVEEISERYGRWQDKECHTLKGMLLDLEKPGTGRVRLEDFYAPGLHNKSWQFTESVQYLQQLGALDESNPLQKTVIISNYVNSPANCVASSKFYSVCCIDQCEDLLATLERKIAAPDATPDQIVTLVASLASDTVQVPYTLPASLVQRLQDIAAHHGGLVPLHGRLFAQWMHHAYPRECPYPHLAGTTRPLTQEEWIDQTTAPLQAEHDEIRALLDAARESDSTMDVTEHVLPWSHEEELFVRNPRLPQESQGKSFISRIFMFVSAVFLLMAWSASRFPSPIKSKGFQKADHKYYV